ncbi:UvrD-helicase domain-containing protein [Terriglobus tenax]|uniref:UvrD-helicase domain-containing protein n=1 Tax=Terriglobus tenax TaxID=1111115 RepID=UPI0021E06951|nr:UvrD-helicase domain-containing protein [Terriglobus tenax]
MNKRPTDFAQRQAALNTRASILVEAPAGSGKTGLLILRYLKLLADSSVEQPEQILAITFTRKATAEMKARVFEALESARTQPEPQADDEFDHKLQIHRTATEVLTRDAELGWSLLSNPGRLNIRTIDSVCTELARSMPVLAGAGALQQPVDDASALYREAAARTLRLLGGDDPQLNADIRTLLLHRDGNLSGCEALIAEMLALREQWGHIVPLTGDLSEQALDNDVRPRLEAAIRHILCTELTRLRDTLGDDLAHRIARMAAAFGEEPSYASIPNPYVLCVGLARHPDLEPHALEQWKTFATMFTTGEGKAWRSGSTFNRKNMKVDASPALQQQFKYLLADVARNDALLPLFKNILRLPEATYPDDQWQVAKALFRLLRAAMVELRLLFAERGQCDFSELSLAARAALDHDATAATLAAGLGMRLQHLLVDEVQDTSTSQYDLLEKLTEGWDGVSQTIFLVGDPKQSIYLFRQARVERFLETMKTGRLGTLPLHVVQLTTNFRSQQHLVEAFNRHFTPIFSGDEITYTAAAPHLAPETKNAFQWNGYVSSFAQSSPEGKREAREQTREFARTIATLVRTGAGSKAVLVRDRKHLLDVIAAFRAEHIPYRAVEIDSLAERIEIFDLQALTRALLHPADRPAWFAILRAPWCGLSLADLHLIAGQDDHSLRNHPVPRLLAERIPLLPAEAAQRAGRVWAVLEAALAERGTQSTARWVERTWRSLGGDLGLTSDALANAEAYFRLLDALETTGASLSTLPERLKKLYATPEHHPEAVDLLTIHKSKGLEWDTVFVPALERRSGSNGSRALTWLELESHDHLILLSPIADSETKSNLLTSWINNIHNSREASERKRLFYVAATRARKSLHLFAVTHTGAKGEVKPQTGTLLDAAWPAAQAHFAPVLAPVLPFPAPLPEEEGLTLAAAAEGGPMRLPTDFNPTAFLTAPEITPPEQPAVSTYQRPQGDVEARSFGNVVHLLVESLADSIARGVEPDVSQWHSRAHALLRMEGTPPDELAQASQQVVRALEKMLLDPEGRWLLEPHTAAATEFALEDETGRRLRTDRTFVAGPAPLAPGEATLWIVDFKSSTLSGGDLNAFLSAQKRIYAPKMTQYARTKRAESSAETPIMLALYFPLLPALLYWPAE